MNHNLKCHPEPFKALKDEIKNFEFRKFDRPYAEGDTLTLQEWNPDTKQYTGDEIMRPVDYLITDKFGIPADYVIMSWQPFHKFMEAK